VPEASREIVILAAFLHDVGDEKYLKPGEDASRHIHDMLISMGASESLASKIQEICQGVSYSTEIKNPELVLSLIKKHPELGIIQDADRLDAIGAVGIGRTFTYGGARNRSLEATMAHFDEKLLHLGGMMKTPRGLELAKTKIERLKLMQQWWKEETDGIGE
jgi:uncharacterized protein